MTPTVAAAFDVVHARWRAGDRDRELALHLMFLAWYLFVEPAHLTGLDPDRVSVERLVAMFDAAHAWLLPHGADSDDAEALYVAGLMARLFAPTLGPVAPWDARSEAYRLRYRQLVPDGLAPTVFAGRGAYGDYFASQVQVAGGY